MWDMVNGAEFSRTMTENIVKEHIGNKVIKEK